MDKEKVLDFSRTIFKKISKWFFLFREYCNYYTASTALIFAGLAIFLVNQLRLGFYSLIVLGAISIVMHYFYNRQWFLSLLGSFLLSIGTYITLLLSNLLPDGGEVAIVLAVGVGFLVFYGIEGRWNQYWPLIPGSCITVFGILIYLHQTQQKHFGFIPVIYRFWPLIIILFGVMSLFSKDLKKRIFLLKNKISLNKISLKK